ncbi:MAG: GNAT family N-acetyltransferase [Marmoricola sp.]
MLRPATDTDVVAIRDWRNQDVNRAVSNNQHEISLDEHLAWWDRIQYDPSKRVLVFTHGDRALGVVSFFDLELDGPGPRTGAWGFFLDHETATAEGVATMAWIQVMKDATAYAFDELGLDVLTGEVNSDNEAVRAMNRRFRFTEGEPETREDGRVFYPISLRREDRRMPKPAKEKSQ